MRGVRRYGCVCFFFFFQAEDGIRDLTVTGVQTCALPIYPSRAMPVIGAVSAESRRMRRRQAIIWSLAALATLSIGAFVWSLLRVPLRSEERRVGKECRSRWSPYH